MRKNDPVLDRTIEDHLRSAFSIERKPWDELPFRSITINDKREDDVRQIENFVERGEMVAIDFETNRLKPDAENANIRTCAISDGFRTLAYPMLGNAIEATRELLRSKTPKVAANMKFEDRWSRAVLRCRPRNWCWDTMLAQHVLDNRSHICGLKFMSFVHLGQSPYDGQIRPYLEQTGPDGTNRVYEAPLRELLVYNGMDALLEHEIATMQIKTLS
jgi:hypothetical protein